MKVDLVVCQDIALFGKKRKTGTVLGTFEMPDAQKESVVGAKLRAQLVSGGLDFRVRPGATKAKTKAKGGAAGNGGAKGKGGAAGDGGAKGKD